MKIEEIDFEDLYAPTCIEGEGKLHSTYGPDGKADAERVAKVNGGVIRPYGIELQETDPKTKRTVKWEKVPGFSVWLE